MSRGSKIIHHQYPDHHQFNEKNITKLVNVFYDLADGDNLIITTEKDAQRLGVEYISTQLKELPIYSLPIEAEFREPEKTKFNQYIEEYASKSARNH